MTAGTKMREMMKMKMIITIDVCNRTALTLLFQIDNTTTATNLISNKFLFSFFIFLTIIYCSQKIGHSLVSSKAGIGSGSSSSRSGTTFLRFALSAEYANVQAFLLC